MEKSNRKK